MRRNGLAAGLGTDPLGELTALPNLLAIWGLQSPKNWKEGEGNGGREGGVYRGTEGGPKGGGGRESEKEGSEGE